MNEEVKLKTQTPSKKHPGRNKMSGTVYHTWRLLAISYIKNPSQVFMSFIYPLIFIFILGKIMPPVYLLPGIMTLIPSTIALLVMPQQIVDYKTSSLLKRIGATKMKNSTFIFCALTFYIMVAIVAEVGIGTIGYFLYIDKMKDQMPSNWTINWASLVFAAFLTFLLTFSIGIMLASILKSQQMALLFGLLLTVPTGFLSGQFIPIGVINKVKALQWASHFMPLKYPTVAMSQAWFGDSIFRPHDWYAVDTDVLETFQKTLNSFGHTDKYSIFQPGAASALNADMIQYATGAATSELGHQAIITNAKDFKVIMKHASEWLAAHNTTCLAEKIIGILYYVIPIGLSCIFIPIAIWKFKWSSR